MQSALSVVIANYNHAHFLPQALDSILSQSYLPLEIIIIDDGSTDNSIAVIESYARKTPLIRLYPNGENKGTIFSANRGLRLASGQYVHSASADDWILPGLYEKSMSMLARYPKAGLCSAVSRVVDATSGKQINLLPLKKVSTLNGHISPVVALENLRRRENWFTGNTCIYHRKALLEAGGLIPELGAFSDGFIQLVLALKHGVCFIPETLGVFRISAAGYAANSVSSIDVSMKMWSQAAHLMRTTYADLFPADYVNSWERERYCYARLSALNKLQKQSLSVLETFWERMSLCDRLFLFGVRMAMRAVLMAMVSYLTVRFRRQGMWPVVAGKVRGVLQRLGISVRPALRSKSQQC